mmetsp:Transcript_8416/g.10971  ORF Transcript_8416/g.10971 Transcript_8416/m.10971 type:complete len:85 (+) Transcript_8416:114-368(+)
MHYPEEQGSWQEVRPVLESSYGIIITSGMMMRSQIGLRWAAVQRSKPVCQLLSAAEALPLRETPPLGWALLCLRCGITKRIPLF